MPLAWGWMWGTECPLPRHRMTQAVKPFCFSIILSPPSKPSYVVVHVFVVPVASHCPLTKPPFLKAAVPSEIKSSCHESEGRERSPEREGSSWLHEVHFPITVWLHGGLFGWCFPAELRKYHKPSVSKQQKCIFPQLWKPEVQNQGVGRAGCFLGSQRETPFHSSPLASSGHQQSLAILGLWKFPADLCLCSHRVIFSICLCLSVSSNKDASHIGLRAHPIPVWPHRNLHLNYMGKDYFQIRSNSQRIFLGNTI